MVSWDPNCDVSISDSEEESEALLNKVNGQECIIYIVDGNLYKTGLLENALLLLRSSFLSGLLVNDRDLISLIFVNTQNHFNESYEECYLGSLYIPDNCSVFLPPLRLTTSVMDKFLRFVETAPAQFEKMYGIIADGVSCNFSHVLRLCMDLVQKCKYFANNTTIIFLTDNEAPHTLNSEYYHQTLQKAVDLKNKDIEFLLIPMVDIFNYDNFYKEIICLIQDIDIECFQPAYPQEMREMLANRKFKQHYLRRSLGHFNFFLGTNLILSAQYFKYYLKQARPSKLLLQRTDSAVVQKHRITRLRKHDFDLENTKELNVNIKNAWYEINVGSNVRLSYSQVDRIRKIHQTGMVLLGFKPLSQLDCTLFCKCANFMYPDNSAIGGSKRLFRALWEKCIERKKIVICLFMCKRKSMPRYVALVPIDNVNRSNYQLPAANNGFKIVYLSCCCYVRWFNLSDWNLTDNQADDEETRVCEKLVKKFRLDYKPDILCDPHIDQLRSKLLKLAFNIYYDTWSNQYFPNLENQNLRICSMITTFKTLFGEISDVPKIRSNSSRIVNKEKRTRYK